MTLVKLRSTESESIWGRDQDAFLATGLGELGLPAGPGQLLQLRTYGTLLLKWNQTFNLLGTTSATALVRDHLLDSLAILPALSRWLPAKKSILADIGSGAGLPGIVLAIMLEPLRVVLVEPSAKKTAFLRQSVAACNLSRVRVVEARVEQLDAPRDLLAQAPQQPGHPPSCGDKPHLPPSFICRAFASLERFSSLCRPHLQDGSLLFAMKATRVDEEVQALDGWIDVLAVEPVRTIDKNVQRNLVVMRSKKTHRISDPTPPPARRAG